MPRLEGVDARALRAPVVVVGAGPVGMRAAQVLLQRDPDLALVIYGGEAWEPYNRVRLTSALAGEVPSRALINRLVLPEKHRVTRHYHWRVVSIDRVRHTVTDVCGRTQPYRKLILATGSRAVIPALPGVALSGVYTFRDRNDLERLSALRGTSCRAVVLGGGLLGLEVARALRHGNTEVTVIEVAPRLLPRQLDEGAAACVADYLRASGIRVVLGKPVECIVGKGSVDGIRLRTGEFIACDALVLAVGIQPVTELAREAGLPVECGILVDDGMRTADPDIFAVGECAEHRGKVYGLAGPGLEQAAVAASCVLGGGARYRGSAESASLKVVGLPVFSVGRRSDAGGRPSRKRGSSFTCRDTGGYRKLFLQGRRLAGAIGVGEWEERFRVHETVLLSGRLWPWQIRRFRRTGGLWPARESARVSDWPAAATVCQCTGVTRGVLGAALSQGCNDLESLTASTGAASVCGSCKPLLAELLGDRVARQPVRCFRGFLYASLLALAGALGVSAASPIAFAPTVQSVRHILDALWREGLLKQISGYTLLAVTVLTLSLSLRKRWGGRQWGNFARWRLFHMILGVLTLVLLVLHTGFRLGENLNFLLMASFLGLLLAGAGAGTVVALEPRLGPAAKRRLRTVSTWTHIVLFWPLPVLLIFHILSVYYF